MNRLGLFRKISKARKVTSIFHSKPLRRFSLLELSQNVSDTEGNRFLVDQFLKIQNEAVEMDQGTFPCIKESKLGTILYSYWYQINQIYTRFFIIIGYLDHVYKQMFKKFAWVMVFKSECNYKIYFQRVLTLFSEPLRTPQISKIWFISAPCTLVFR